MNFPKDFLAELETPTRIFRTNMDKYVSPTKPRNKDAFLNDLFLSKRETLELDDCPNFNLSIKDEFFYEDKTKPEVKATTTMPAEPETRETSEQVDGPSPQTVKENPIPIPSKFESLKKVTETIVEPKKLKRSKNIENDFLSDQESKNPSIRRLTSPKIESVAEALKQNTEGNSFEAGNNKYQEYIQHRTSNGISDKNNKRKKTGMQSLERNQLKSRANRVSQFWKGTNNFIPSVFKVIKLEIDPKRAIIEFQDFSLKGLCHMDENAEDGNQTDSKLSIHLDRLGDENLNEIYKIMDTRTLL